MTTEKLSKEVTSDKIARLNRDHKKLRKRYHDLSVENSELRKQIEELRASWAVRLPYDWARIK